MGDAPSDWPHSYVIAFSDVLRKAGKQISRLPGEDPDGTHARVIIQLDHPVNDSDPSAEQAETYVAYPARRWVDEMRHADLGDDYECTVPKRYLPGIARECSAALGDSVFFV